MDDSWQGYSSCINAKLLLIRFNWISIMAKFKKLIKNEIAILPII
jgi:hypothetical protein